MTIRQETIQVGSTTYYKTYSDSGYIITRDGKRYVSAIDTSQLTYTETSDKVSAYSDLDTSMSSESLRGVTNSAITNAISQRANDNEVIHTTGDETATGTKRFAKLLQGKNEVIDTSCTATKEKPGIITKDYIDNAIAMPHDEIGRDDAVYKNINEMRHTTFDPNKFPNDLRIDENGIFWNSSKFLLITKYLVTNNSWTLNLKFQTGSNISSPQFLFNLAFWNRISIEDGKLRWYLGYWHEPFTWTHTSNSYSIQANTWYWVHSYYDKSKYVLEISTDGENFTTVYSIDDTFAYLYNVSNQTSLGIQAADGNYAFTGKLDLEYFLFTTNNYTLNGAELKRLNKGNSLNWNSYDGYICDGFASPGSWCNVTLPKATTFDNVRLKARIQKCGFITYMTLNDGNSSGLRITPNAVTYRGYIPATDNGSGGGVQHTDISNIPIGDWVKIDVLLLKNNTSLVLISDVLHEDTNIHYQQIAHSNFAGFTDTDTSMTHYHEYWDKSNDVPITNSNYLTFLQEHPFTKLAFIATNDLKYLQVYCNGLEIFNGNKSGVDILQDDNFVENANCFTVDDYGVAHGVASVTKFGVPNAIPQVNTKDGFILEGQNYTNSNTGLDLGTSIGRLFFRLSELSSNSSSGGYSNYGNNITCWRVHHSDEIKLQYNVEETAVTIKSFTPIIYHVSDILYWKLSVDNLKGTFHVWNNESTVYNFTFDIPYMEFNYAYFSAEQPVTLDDWSNLNRFILRDKTGKILWRPCVRVPYTLTSSGSKVIDPEFAQEDYDTFPYYIDYGDNVKTDIPVNKYTLENGIVKRKSNDNQYQCCIIRTEPFQMWDPFEVGIRCVIDANFVDNKVEHQLFGSLSGNCMRGSIYNNNNVITFWYDAESQYNSDSIHPTAITYDELDWTPTVGDILDIVVGFDGTDTYLNARVNEGDWVKHYGHKGELVIGGDLLEEKGGYGVSTGLYLFSFWNNYVSSYKGKIDLRNTYIKIGDTYYYGMTQNGYKLPKQDVYADTSYLHKDTIGGYSLPSNKSDDLTISATGDTITAPANGWLAISVNTNNGYLAMTNLNSNVITSETPSTNAGINLFMPVMKGDVVRIDYSNVTTFNQFKFIYTN